MLRQTYVKTPHQSKQRQQTHPAARMFLDNTVRQRHQPTGIICTDRAPRISSTQSTTIGRQNLSDRWPVVGLSVHSSVAKQDQRSRCYSWRGARYVISGV